MSALLDRIAEIAAMPGLEPETKRLLEMAAQAQQTGVMPELDFTNLEFGFDDVPDELEALEPLCGQYAMIYRTMAAQRAEAFLRTHNLWKE